MLKIHKPMEFMFEGTVINQRDMQIVQIPPNRSGAMLIQLLARKSIDVYSFSLKRPMIHLEPTARDTQTRLNMFERTASRKYLGNVT